MRIAIVNLTGGGMSGGYKNYLRHILPLLAANPQATAILCAAPATVGVRDWCGQLPNVTSTTCQPWRWHNLFLPFRDPSFRRQLDQFNPEVIFVPVERPFRFNHIPTVTMIQNMEPLAYRSASHPLKERFKQWLQRQTARRAIRQADRVIAISGFVRDWLQRQWHVPAAKIGLVYHGVEVPSGNEGVQPKNIPAAWAGRFLLTVGSLRPARGLDDLVQALRQRPQAFSAVAGIVIAGPPAAVSLEYLADLRQQIAQAGWTNRVCWAGELSPSEVQWCYRHCQLMVMTSRVEACPTVALEALAAGAVCIAANNPPLPEIFADSAEYYHPRSPDDLARVISDLSHWSTEHITASQHRAQQRATDFTWQEAADRTLSELQLVL